MEGKQIALTALAVIGCIVLIKRMRNQNAKNTNAENETTADLSDFETQQAVLLKKYLGVYSVAGVYYTGPANLNDSYGVANVCNRIVNWAKVQKKFSALCDNQFTLLRAMEGGLTDNNFRICLNLAKADKVVTTKNADCYVLNSVADKESTGQVENFSMGTVLGAKNESGYFFIQYPNYSESVKAYSFLSGYDSNKNEVFAFVEQNNAKIVTP